MVAGRGSRAIVSNYWLSSGFASGLHVQRRWNLEQLDWRIQSESKPVPGVDGVKRVDAGDETSRE